MSIKYIYCLYFVINRLFDIDFRLDFVSCGDIPSLRPVYLLTSSRRREQCPASLDARAVSPISGRVLDRRRHPPGRQFGYYKSSERVSTAVGVALGTSDAGVRPTLPRRYTLHIIATGMCRKTNWLLCGEHVICWSHLATMHALTSVSRDVAVRLKNLLHETCDREELRSFSYVTCNP